MRPIDADALRESLFESSQFDTYNDYSMVIDTIDLAPTLEERKKGKWIPVDSFSAFGGDESMWMAHGNPVAFYYCSNCKEQAYAEEDGYSLITDFCPNCGAKMGEDI